MRAVFLRHPYLVTISMLLVVALAAYGCWFASPLISNLLSPVLMVLSFLFLSRRWPATILDWIFVVLILLPASAVLLSLIEVLQPILPLVIAVSATLAIQNKFVTSKRNGLSDSDNNNRRV